MQIGRANPRFPARPCVILLWLEARRCPRRSALPDKVTQRDTPVACDGCRKPWVDRCHQNTFAQSSDERVDAQGGTAKTPPRSLVNSGLGVDCRWPLLSHLLSQLDPHYSFVSMPDASPTAPTRRSAVTLDEWIRTSSWRTSRKGRRKATIEDEIDSGKLIDAKFSKEGAKKKDPDGSRESLSCPKGEWIGDCETAEKQPKFDLQTRGNSRNNFPRHVCISHEKHGLVSEVIEKEEISKNPGEENRGTHQQLLKMEISAGILLVDHCDTMLLCAV